MKKIICFWIFLAFVLTIQAQRENVDSLINVLNTQPFTSVEQLDLYYKICHIYSRTNPKNSAIYSKRGLMLAEKEREYSMASRFSEYIAITYDGGSNFDSSSIYWKKALDHAVTAKDKKLEASMYYGMGISARRQGKHVSALEYYMKVLPIFEDMRENKLIIQTLANIGGLFRTLDNTERAIYYLNKAKILAEELNDSDG